VLVRQDVTGPDRMEHQLFTWTSGSSFLRPFTTVPPRIAPVRLMFDW
jgi:hypothetical protein